MSLVLVVKNAPITIPVSSLVNHMPNKQYVLDVLKRNIQLNKIDLDRIPIYSAQLNFKLCLGLDTNILKVIQINHALIKTPTTNAVPEIFKNCTNIFHWVTMARIRINNNLVVQYNEGNYLNIGNKFIDFKLQTIYECPIYYHKIIPKYVVIEDPYGQVKYRLIEKLIHKRTLILTNHPTKNTLWPKMTNIHIHNYKHLNKLIAKSESWNLIILDLPPLSQSSSCQIKKLTQLKTEFGIIFINDSKDEQEHYHKLYSIITQNALNDTHTQLPANHNLHNFLLTNYFRKIEFPANLHITKVPLKFTPIETKIYSVIPDKLTFCANSKIFQTITPIDHPCPCYICDFKIENMVTPKCGHHICLNCICNSTKCPLCRMPIEFTTDSLKIETNENIGTKINYLAQQKNTICVFVKDKTMYSKSLVETYQIIDTLDNDLKCHTLIILEPIVLTFSEVKEWLHTCALKNIKIIIPYILDTVEVELVK